jgi:hypothetical protein
LRPVDALAGRWLFRPSRQPIDCRKQQRWVTRGSRRIDVWCEGSGQRPRLFVLRFLGARGRAEHGTRDPVNRFDPFPGEVWIANPPGFGQTSGRPSPADYCDDALAVFDALRAHAGDAPIWVQGQSLGTLAALHVAANRSVDWLILRNVTPASLLAGRVFAPLSALAQGCLPDAFDALRSAQRAQADALFVTSRQDRIATPALQARVYGRYAGPKQQLFVDCGHEDHVLPDADEIRYRDIVARRLAALGLR